MPPRVAPSSTQPNTVGVEGHHFTVTLEPDNNGEHTDYTVTGTNTRRKVWSNLTSRAWIMVDAPKPILRCGDKVVVGMTDRTRRVPSADREKIQYYILEMKVDKDTDTTYLVCSRLSPDGAVMDEFEVVEHTSVDSIL